LRKGRNATPGIASAQDRERDRPGHFIIIAWRSGNGTVTGEDNHKKKWGLATGQDEMTELSPALIGERMEDAGPA